MSSWYDDCYDDNTGWVSSTVNDWDKGKYRNVMMKVVSQKSTNWYNAEEVCKKHCARLGRVADAYISFVGTCIDDFVPAERPVKRKRRKSSSISVPGLQTTTQMSSKEWFPEDRGLPIAVQAYVLHILIVVILDTMKTYFVFFIFERE
ncbi:unnamed protein product [Nippostrongylus brasiliensis]|uniref:CW domain-containing protein n=1 Tax=Nippostrongylus brasiliensis TaxID=27835 RepID=A0A0N4Y9C8_NIPBR|nr:unnamed protein product [Nippostrongylus brasiliensis]